MEHAYVPKYVEDLDRIILTAHITATKQWTRFHEGVPKHLLSSRAVLAGTAVLLLVQNCCWYRAGVVLLLLLLLLLLLQCCQ
jgi:hypothetical protein